MGDAADMYERMRKRRERLGTEPRPAQPEPPPEWLIRPLASVLWEFGRQKWSAETLRRAASILQDAFAEVLAASRRNVDMARQQAGTRAARISELEADLAAARRERDEAVTKALMERLVSKGLEAAHRVHLQGERDVAREDCRVSHTVERQRIVALETRLEHAELQQHSLTAGIELANERRQEAESEAAALRERLNLARQAILRDGYFNPAQVSDDIAPRILERVAALRERVGRLEAALRHAAIRDHPHTDWCRGCENVAAALAPAPAKSEGVA